MLLLALRTIEAGALSLLDLFDGGAALAAGLADAAVDPVVLLEVAGFAVAVDEVAQRAAALLDRFR